MWILLKVQNLESLLCGHCRHNSRSDTCHKRPSKLHQTLNPVVIDTDRIGDSKLVLFVIPLATIMLLTTMCMSSTTATTTCLLIPLLLKLCLVLSSAILVMRLIAMIKVMIFITIETYSDATIKNPIVGGCKVVVQIIGITGNTFDFCNCGSRRRRTMGRGCNGR